MTAVLPLPPSAALSGHYAVPVRLRPEAAAAALAPAMNGAGRVANPYGETLGRPMEYRNRVEAVVKIFAFLDVLRAYQKSFDARWNDQPPDVQKECLKELDSALIAYGMDDPDVRRFYNQKAQYANYLSPRDIQFLASAAPVNPAALAAISKRAADKDDLNFIGRMTAGKQLGALIRSFAMNPGDPVIEIGPNQTIRYLALAALGHPVAVFDHPQMQELNIAHLKVLRRLDELGIFRSVNGDQWLSNLVVFEYVDILSDKGLETIQNGIQTLEQRFPHLRTRQWSLGCFNVFWESERTTSKWAFWGIGSPEQMDRAFAVFNALPLKTALMIEPGENVGPFKAWLRRLDHIQTLDIGGPPSSYGVRDGIVYTGLAGVTYGDEDLTAIHAMRLNFGAGQISLQIAS